MANTFELLLKIINQASNRKLQLIAIDLNDLPSFQIGEFLCNNFANKRLKG